MCSWHLIDRQSCLQHEGLCGIAVVTSGAIPATLVFLYLGFLGLAVGITLLRQAKEGSTGEGGYAFGALLLIPCSIADMVFNIMGVFFHDQGAVAFAEKLKLVQDFNLVFDFGYLALGIVLAIRHFRIHKKKAR